MSGQVRMLLVDDDQSLVCSLAAVVSKHLAEKVCLTEMTDSVAAKDWIEERSPDLVLTDLQMPMVDGFGILEIAKKRNPSCQVIIHSGHFSEETLSLALRLGATDYLVKSDGVDDLLHALEQAHSRIVRWKRVSAAPSTLL